MKRRSVSQNRELPWLSVPVPCTWATPTKPLKLVIVLGSPPTRPVVVLSAGPGSWKWMSGPPSRWKFGMAPGMGRGVPLGRLRSSRRSRDNWLFDEHRHDPGRGARAAPRRGASTFRWPHHDGYHIIALLLAGGLRYKEKASLPARRPGAGAMPGR